MRPLDTLVDRLLRRAADRWPSEEADDMYREWRAEVAWLRDTPGAARWTTALRSLRFALSLATSTPETGRERPNAHPSAVVPLLRAVASAVVAVAVAASAWPIVTVLLSGYSPHPDSRLASAGRFIAIGLIAAAFGLVGSRLRDRRPRPVTGVLLLSVALLVMWLPDTRLWPWPALLSVALWSATVIPLLAVTARRASRTGAMLTGTIGAVALLHLIAVGLGVLVGHTDDVASAPAEAPWWFLQSLTAVGEGLVAEGVYPVASRVLPVLVPVTAFVLTWLHTGRHARPVPAPPPAAPVDRRLLVPAGTAAAVAGIALWCAGSWWLGLADADRPWEVRWLWEFRWAGLALLVLGMAVRFAGLGTAVSPVLGLAVVSSPVNLFTQDHDTPARLVAAGTAVVVAVVVAEWWSRSRPRPVAASTRNGLAVVAMSAAGGAPTMLWSEEFGLGASFTGGWNAAQAAVIVALLGVAAVATRAVAPRPAFRSLAVVGAASGVVLVALAWWPRPTDIAIWAVPVLPTLVAFGVAARGPLGRRGVGLVLLAFPVGAAVSHLHLMIANRLSGVLWNVFPDAVPYSFVVPTFLTLAVLTWLAAGWTTGAAVPRPATVGAPRAQPPPRARRTAW
ncbi:hypothetical protein LX16_1996 [Stackebrandtia albiflava]|uniref:Uncharacterized protein n=1 Tax=Stackebrandtia albiflava TaxID=406432 RepID=A0A562VEF2_9ACTN|nr:hypothetical protein [Stackebrandtia albiflava]TWJ16269.1 hypothetical protein LX16_1996 [Stackebrandtia albiflava]